MYGSVDNSRNDCINENKELDNQEQHKLRCGKRPDLRYRHSNLELGAKKFHEQRTTGPLLFESAPAPPSAGFNVTFEDLTLDTAAGAPLIFARLTEVTTKLL